MCFGTSRPRFTYCVLWYKWTRVHVLCAKSKPNATSVLLGSHCAIGGQGSLARASVNGSKGSQCVLLVAHFPFMKEDKVPRHVLLSSSLMFLCTVALYKSTRFNL